MTRYEAWLPVPVVAAYYFCKTGKAIRAGFKTMCLLAFPVAWMMGNFLYADNFVPFLYPQTTMARNAVGANSVDFVEAITILARKAFAHLAWIPFVAIAVAVLVVGKSFRRESDWERAVYMAIVFVIWILWSLLPCSGDGAYLIAICCSALCGFALRSVAADPYLKYRGLIVVVFLAIISSGLSNLVFKAERYVKRKQPVAIKEVADWLQSGSYNDGAILMTKMDGGHHIFHFT